MWLPAWDDSYLLTKEVPTCDAVAAGSGTSFPADHPSPIRSAAIEEASTARFFEDDQGKFLPLGMLTVGSTIKSKAILSG